LNNVNAASICGNHFKQNDIMNTGAQAHIRFSASVAKSDNVTFCGNVYVSDVEPQYVYDAGTTAQAITPSTSGLYESPTAQPKGVFSPNALSNLLPYVQFSPGYMNDYITGLTLSNVGASATMIDIAAGQAADSTNSMIIALPPARSPCLDDLNLAANPAPGGLDTTGMAAANTTYFYFVIAGANMPTSCVASTATSPNLTGAAFAGYTNYRLVGALYTNASSTIVSFVQNGNKFTLAPSVAFSPSGFLPATSTPVNIPSVPSMINVQAFGRCVASPAVLLSDGSIAAQTPSATFTTTPGYMVTSLTPNTSFPFSLYTLGGSGSTPGGSINGAGSTSTTTLHCYDDGWTLKLDR
jgi:hypothetical protein